MRAPVLRLAQNELVFEWYPSDATVRVSEVLPEFKVFRDEQEVYSGRAVVSNWLDLGSVSACQVKLDQPGLPALPVATTGEPHAFLPLYETAFQQWEGRERTPAAVKLAVLDVHNYLSFLKSHLEQLELSIKSHPQIRWEELTAQALGELSSPILRTIDTLHERFEVAAAEVSPEDRSSSETLVQRMLHPLFLCAPFAHRTYYKPLGYAGDYEMMNMIMRNGFEGESLYAKLVHHWLVRQWAALSVRNRIAHLKCRLKEEATRVLGLGRPFRVLDVGCGPAWEVREFIEQYPRADAAEFTLLDFDNNAMKHVTAATAEAKARHGRRTEVRTVRMSVNQLIKESVRGSGKVVEPGFDMIYCVGLFDYLNDRTCRQLTALFYEWSAPGGLVAVANMKDEKPFRHMVEYLLDWHLLYRDSHSLWKFRPAPAALEDCKVVGEPLAVNLFLEVRKPHLA